MSNYKILDENPHWEDYTLGLVQFILRDTRLQDSRNQFYKWWDEQGHDEFHIHRARIGRLINNTRGLSYAAIKYLEYQYPLWDKNEEEWKKRYNNERLAIEQDLEVCLGVSFNDNP